MAGDSNPASSASSAHCSRAGPPPDTRQRGFNARMDIGRNDPCHCGSGKKYKRCHLDIDRDAGRALLEVSPSIAAQNAKHAEVDRRLRDEYGVHINYVAPILWHDRKVWAIGSRVYFDRPANETFHEFLISVLRETFGEAWRADQAALPDDGQHIVMRCSREWGRWTAAHADADALARDGHQSARPSGWVQYLISLAWDAATIMHASNMPSALVDRLRDPVAFQGARYEVAIAAIFARLDYEIRFLDDDEERRAKHVEFVATHRKTRHEVAVEAKSRHRPGVLNQQGAQDADDPLRGDARGVRALFTKALEKAPETTEFMVFIDINAPIKTPGLDGRWKHEVMAWINRMPAPTPDAPDVYNGLYVTNFSPHYEAEDLSAGGTWMGIVPQHTRIAPTYDLSRMLERALDNYARVPSFAEDGGLLG